MDTDSFIALYDSPYTGRTVAYCGPEGLFLHHTSAPELGFVARRLADFTQLELVDFTA